MALQRTKLLGDLYYGDTPTTFVPPPVKEIKALSQQKENDFLLAKAGANELDKIMRTLPYREQSSPVYNRLKANTEMALSQINSGNYEDKVLDVENLANNIYNKWGATQLVDEYSQMQNAQKELDTAYDKGEIKDAEFLAYKKQQLAQQPGLAITQDGYVSRPKIAPATFAKYVDIPKKYNDLFQGWKEDGTITVDNSGRIKVTKDIPGYLTSSEKDFISEAELFNAATRMMQSDDEAQSYLTQKAQFDTRNIPANADSLNSILTPQQKKVLFGKENADTADIQLAISNGLDAQKVITTLNKEALIADNASFLSDKFGFTKEKLNTYKDELLFKALDTMVDNNKSKDGDNDMSNVSVTIQPFKYQQELNPTDIKAISTLKTNLTNQRTSLQQKINNYSKAVQNNQQGYTQDELDRLNREQTVLDGNIADIVFQEQQLGKIWKDTALKNGVDFSKVYKESKKANTDFVVGTNIERLVKANDSGLVSGRTVNNVTVNVTDKVRVNSDGTAIINGVKGNKAYDVETAVNNNRRDSYIIKSGNEYTFVPGKSDSGYALGVLRDLRAELFDADGNPTDRINIADDNVRKNLLKSPNEEQFNQLAVKAYNDGSTSTWIGQTQPEYESDGMYVNSAFTNAVEKVKSKAGDFNWSITTPLSYLMVQGETSKSNLVAYTNGEKALNESFKKSPAQYSIPAPDGSLMELGTYIKEELGIPSLDSEYIDWDKTDIVTLSQTDRQYGQKYGINLVLTKEGKKNLNSGWFDGDKDKTYSMDNAIKIVGVNESKNVPAEQAEIQNRLLKAYADVSNDTTAHGINMKKEMGLLYFNNSKEGSDFDRNNFYTMSAGASKDINIRGTNYKISTTARDANASDLMNVNFHLGKIENNQDMVLATGVAGENKGKSLWLPTSQVDGSSEYSRVVFETPNDLKAIMGASMLGNDKASTQTKSNPYLEYLQGSNYTSIGNNSFQTNNYKKVVNSVKSYYGEGSFLATIKNNRNGKTETISTRIPANELYDIKTGFPNKVSNNVAYPFINKAVQPYVEKILTDNDLIVTGGFRGNTTHDGLADSAEDSFHKYGYSLDLRADKNGLDFYEKVAKNPKLAEAYGIVKALKHGEGANFHVHLEFKPNSL